MDCEIGWSPVICRGAGAVCLVRQPVHTYGSRHPLAPWDPTHNLVASGPYQYVRNPMILAVVVMLAGEVLFWGSAILGFYLVVFVLVNQVYFILSEEPGLDRRFGEPYRTYKTHVPRWIPRAKPWPGK